MPRLVLALLLGVTALSAVDGDPYASWAAGRPAEALPALVAAARSGDWQAAYDCGLAAHAAGERGLAVVALLTAHRRAVLEDAPPGALAALGVELPSRPVRFLAAPARWTCSGYGLVLAVLAGAALGLGLARRRRLVLAIGVLLSLVLLPGLLTALLLDAPPLVATLRATALLDSTGTPIPGGSLPAGRLLERTDTPPWAGRAQVVLPDGRRGWVPQTDLQLPERWPPAW